MKLARQQQERDTQQHGEHMVGDPEPLGPEVPGDGAEAGVDQGQMTLEEFIQRCRQEVATKGLATAG